MKKPNFEVGDRIEVVLCVAEKSRTIKGKVKEILILHKEDDIGVILEDEKTFVMSRVIRQSVFPRRDEEGNMKKVYGSPVVSLKSGITICNFSSAHPFTFDDGSVLPACSKEICDAAMLHSHEVMTENEGGWLDVALCFSMSEPVLRRLEAMQNLPEIDIILVPFPVMRSWKEMGRDIGKMRVVRIKDRAEKIAYSDRFCI